MLIKQIKRYMDWYENRTEKRFGVLKPKNGGMKNFGSFFETEMRQRVSIFYWFFSYQNIITYILKIAFIIGLYTLLFNLINSYVADISTEHNFDLKNVNSAITIMFLPLLSFFMIGCAKGIKKGFIYSFPLCIITLPLIFIAKIFKR